DLTDLKGTSRNGLTWLTRDKDYAQTYAESTHRATGFAGFAPKVGEYYVRATKIFDLDDVPEFDEGNPLHRALERIWPWDKLEYGEVPISIFAREPEAIQALKDAGYDAVEGFMQVHTDKFGGNAHELAVFSPDQVRPVNEATSRPQSGGIAASPVTWDDEHPAYSGPEKRTNIEQRKRIEDMSEKDKDAEIAALRKERLTSEKTGLENYTSFKEDEGKFPHVGYADVDDFKPLNTVLGKVAVDTHVLPAIGEAFRRAIAKEPGGSIKVYHRSGDEFLFRAKDPAAVTRVVERVNKDLAEAVFTAESPDGKIHEKRGAGLSHGTGTTETEAEHSAEVGSHPGSKQQRKEAGLRSGSRDLPGRVGEESATGEQVGERGTAEEVVAPKQEEKPTDSASERKRIYSEIQTLNK